MAKIFVHNSPAIALFGTNHTLQMNTVGGKVISPYACCVLLILMVLYGSVCGLVSFFGLVSSEMLFIVACIYLFI